MGRISLLQSFITLLVLLLFSRSKTRKPLLIFILLCLSVTIKETCIFIPVLILAYDVFVNGARSRNIIFREHALYFSHVIIAIAYHTYLNVLGYNEGSVGFDLYPFFEYVVVQAHYLVFYIYLFINPAIQSIYHAYVEPTVLIYISAITGVIVYVGAIGFIARRLFIESKVSINAFFIVFFLVSLLPTNSILQMYNPFAEYRLYQSNIVLCFYLSLLILIAGRIREVYASLIAGIFVVYFLFFTYSHNFFWRDSLVVWQQAYHDYPNEYAVLSNLGFEYAKRGEFREALKYFKKAEHRHRTYGELESAKNNLANMYHKTGNLKLAYEIYRSLWTNPDTTKDAVFVQNYALITHQLDKHVEFREALDSIEATLGMDYVINVLSKTKSIEERSRSAPNLSQ